MAVWRAWILLVIAAGCHHTSASIAPRPAVPTVAPIKLELPLIKPTIPVLDGKGVPATQARTDFGLRGESFRRLTERDCVLLAAGNASAANLLDDENRVPPASGVRNPAREQLQRTSRYFAALELRNRAAADALDRFFQLSDVEARTELLRDGFLIVDAQLDRAQKAKAANVRFPLELGDLTRRRSQLVTDLEQAEHGSQLLNLDLKRRLGLPYQPERERLWPTGDFAIEAVPDAEQAVGTALADRPELRGLRAAYHGLTPDTLPTVRELLQAKSPLPGQRLPLALRRLLGRNTGPDPATLAELEVRRKQLLDLIADRERAVADETRAALLGMNAQVQRIALARDRVHGWEEKLADAVKKRDANQPGAELLEAQMRTERLRAKAEVVSEVAAWHQARARLKAAQGGFAWEATPEKQ